MGNNLNTYPSHDSIETKHHCQLDHDDQDDIVLQIIGTGVFINLRRIWCKFRMFSDKHPLTQTVLRSKAAKKYEKSRHLLSFPYVIHPFSMLKFYIDVLMLIVFAGIFISVPVYLSIPLYSKYASPYTALNLIHFLFMLLSFNVGYYDRSKHYAVLNRKKIALHYLQSYLITDLLSLVPFAARCYMLLTETMYSIKLIRYLYLLKICRVPYWFNILARIKLFFNIPLHTFRMLKLLLHFCFILLWCYTVVFYINYEKQSEDSRKEYQELGAFYSTVIMLLNVGYGISYADFIKSRICSSAMILLGFILQLLLLTRIMEIWYQFRSAMLKHQTMYSEIDAYVRYNAIPHALRNRIFIYLDFKYQGQFYKESTISAMLSGGLKNEIVMYATKMSTERVFIFNTLKKQLLEKLMARLRSVIYLPGDVIVKAGTVGKSMYFILSGTVTVVTADNIPICNLHDGDSFGEVALVMNETRNASVIAATPCELLKLTKFDFKHILGQYPDVMSALRKMAQRRVAEASMTTSMDFTEYPF